MSQALTISSWRESATISRFYSAVMRQQRFRDGRLTTAYIAEEFAGGFAAVEPDERDAHRLGRRRGDEHARAKAERADSGAMDNHRRAIDATGRSALPAANSPPRCATRLAGRSCRSTTARCHGRERLAAWTTACRVRRRRTRLRNQDGHVGDSLSAALAGMDVGACPLGAHRRTCAADAEEGAAGHVETAALPDAGVITSVAVAAGDEVEAGQTLATVEAMKMENVLRAERRGTVKRVAAKAGDSLAVDQLILEFE